jgi:hypothetical protein
MERHGSDVVVMPLQHMNTLLRLIVPYPHSHIIRATDKIRLIPLSHILNTVDTLRMPGQGEVGGICPGNPPNLNR